MSNAIVRVPTPENEPVRQYAPGSPEKTSLKARLDQMMNETVEVPVVVGGRRIFTGRTREMVCCHDHSHVLGTLHEAGPDEVQEAIAASKEAWEEWSEMPWEARAGVFLKAAELLAGPWRDTVNAATMLNQGKTAYQAEIDSAAELVDFWRFNPHFMRELYEEQPRSADGAWNRAQMRALEGFIFAVTPFNFTSIAGNLPTAPALMGNTVLWKPAERATLSAWYIFELLEEAGLPPGVINFLPGPGRVIGEVALKHEDLAGVHFTGSTPTFQTMWRTVGEEIAGYRAYPRLVGETGGKDFVFAHPSADPQALATALIRGAFEYQGQKCSAASRAYIPSSLWDDVRERLETMHGEIEVGSPLDFRHFMSAVIDERAFDEIMGYIEHAKETTEHEVILGGEGDKSKGYFIQPTVVVSTDPRSKLMTEEIFGPVLTIYVYDDVDFEATLETAESSSPYALTGAIFARDRRDIEKMAHTLRHAAGNFYINDKPTGAVVSQQPFGGGRASGTNDKAGSMLNLLRWVSQRSIKETFVPPTDFRYPHMDEK